MNGYPEMTLDILGTYEFSGIGILQEQFLKMIAG